VAGNLTLLACAAAAPLLLGAGHAAIGRYLPPAGPTAANTAAKLLQRLTGGTDRQTDKRTLNSYIDPAA